jgi:hypothetical protein
MVQSAEFPYPPDLVLNPTVDKEASDFLPKLTAAVGKSKEGYEGLDAVIVVTEPIPAFEYGLSIADFLHAYRIIQSEFEC